MSKRKSRKARPRNRITVRDVCAMQPPLPQAPVDPASTRQPRLTRLQREAIEAAARLQHCQAQSEVMMGTMTIQTHFGWMVRRAHPEAERTIYDAAPEPNGHVETVSHLVTTDRYTRAMVKNRSTHDDAAAARRAELRALTARRAAVYAAMQDEQ